MPNPSSSSLSRPAVVDASPAGGDASDAVLTPLAVRLLPWISSGEIELPVLDKVALRVYRETRSGALDAEGICALLKRDPVLVAEVLRLANSAYFSGLGEVRHLRHAVVRLGTRQIAALALSAGCKRLYGASDAWFRDRLQELWRHTSAVASGSHWLAMHTAHRELADEVFVAGLLHDVGKLLLLRALEELSERDGQRPPTEDIDAVLDALNCSQGAWLLERWGMPETFAELTREFDDANVDPSDTTACIVRFVDKVCAREGISDRGDPAIELESLPECVALGLPEGVLERLVDTLRLGYGVPSV